MEIESLEKIECISCFENRRVILREITLLENVRPKTFLISMQCPSCLTCWSIRYTHSGMAKHVYDSLRKSKILVNQPPARIRMGDSWGYDWNNNIGDYDFSQKKPVRPMET